MEQVNTTDATTGQSLGRADDYRSSAGDAKLSAVADAFATALQPT